LTPAPAGLRDRRLAPARIVADVPRIQSDFRATLRLRDIRDTEGGDLLATL